MTIPNPIDLPFIFYISAVVLLALSMFYILYRIYRDSYKKNIRDQIRFDLDYIKIENDFLFIWYILKDYLHIYDKYISRKMNVKIHPIIFDQILCDGPHGRSLQEIKKTWSLLHEQCIEWLKVNKMDTSLYESINEIMLTGISRLEELSNDKIK